MVLDGFRALLFVPSAPEVSAEIKQFYTAFYSSSPIRAFTPCHLKYGLLFLGYHSVFSTKERKRIDRLEV